VASNTTHAAIRPERGEEGQLQHACTMQPAPRLYARRTNKVGAFVAFAPVAPRDPPAGTANTLDGLSRAASPVPPSECLSIIPVSPQAATRRTSAASHLPPGAHSHSLLLRLPTDLVRGLRAASDRRKQDGERLCTARV